MERTRVKLAVYVDLDPAPGTFDTPELIREAVSDLLQDIMGIYNPQVSIESYDGGPIKAQLQDLKKKLA